MQVRFTLTTDLPTYCIGLFDTAEDAEAFRRQLEGTGLDGVAVTPVFTDDVQPTRQAKRASR